MTKSPNTTCTNCGTKYYRSPSAISRRPNAKTFCSRECKNHYNTEETNCLVCGTPFRQAKSLMERGRPVDLTCSKECHTRYRQKFDDVDICVVCGVQFHVKRYLKGKVTCCSDDCRQKRKIQTLNQYRIQDTGEMIACPNCGKENYYTKYFIERGAHFCDKNCYGEWISKTGARNGENNPAWNPDKTDEEREYSRMTPESHAWRESVFQRDDYTCFRCHTRGGELNAHHMDGFNWYEQGRYDIDNGVTLCKSCHTDFHSKYGSGNNTSTQFIEWMRL